MLVKRIGFHDNGELSEEEVLQAAKEGALWLENEKFYDDQGISWPRSDDHDVSADRNYPNPNSFHAGLAGMIPYLLNMEDLFPGKGYLEEAEEAGERLLKTDDVSRRIDLKEESEDPPLNIYGELPGEAYALYLLYEKTGKESYLDYCRRSLKTIGESAVKTDHGYRWAGRYCYAMAGDAGTLLSLIFLSGKLEDHRYDHVIKGISEELIHLAMKDEDGLYWKALVGKEESPEEAVYWPGLEFGTSGVAQALAEAGAYLKEEEILSSAEKGACHLMKEAVYVRENAVLFSMNTRHPEVFYLGHCYGSMGIAKLFYSLYEKTGKEVYRSFLEKIVNGITFTGAPLVNSSGYWNNDCYCCGTAGLLSLFTGLYAAFKEEEYLYLAEQAAQKLIGDGYHDDGKGLRWYQAYTRLRPYDVHTYNGYILGNAGNVSMLKDLLSAMRKEGKFFRFVEDPFPEEIQ